MSIRKREMILDVLPDRPDTDLGGRRTIGYWFSLFDPQEEIYILRGLDLPSPKDFIDDDWDEAEKEMVASYIDKGETFASWRGWSDCRLGCGGLKGSRDFTDGTYIWPEAFSHYIRVHNVKPPQEFIDHVCNQREKK